MSNYLSKIEAEFSRGRGQSSRLSPLDWNAAAKWEADGIPLRLVLAAMGDGFKTYAAKNPKNSISSLRYFIPAVEKQFDEWKAGQIGKSDTTIFRKIDFEETDMPNLSIAAQTAQSNENTEILSRIADKLRRDDLPAPLAQTVVKIRGEILAIITGANTLTIDDIESRLAAERIELEIALIAATTDDERAAIIKNVQKEFGRFTVLPDVSSKLLIRKLEQKFNLPELTLFAL